MVFPTAQKSVSGKLKAFTKLISSLVAIVIWPIALIVFGLSASIYFLFLLLIPSKRLHWLARIVCRLIILGTGQLLIKNGKAPNPKDGPHLFLFNHQSYLDPFMLGATAREYISAVGGDFQFEWPLWGAVIKRYGAIPIIREKLSAAIHSLSLAEDAIKRGTSFIISPEGTRTTTGKMLPFKKGPFHVAKNTGVTIVPVGIKGAFRAYRRNDWRIYPGVVTIRYGTPIKHDEYENMTLEKLQDFIYKKISTLCDNDKAKEITI